MKSCTVCNKTHRNRKDNLCNDCRPTKEYQMCKCGLHHIYTVKHTVCRTCFKIGLPKEYFFVLFFNFILYTILYKIPIGKFSPVIRVPPLLFCIQNSIEFVPV